MAQRARAVPGPAGAHLLARLRRARTRGAALQRAGARRGKVKAPIVIGRDHLDSGSVASPNRETEAMRDGSDAIADWAFLNALVNSAAGATWVSVHHGGGVGMGYSQHAGMVVVADGTDAAARAPRARAHDRSRHGRHAPRRRRLSRGDRRSRRRTGRASRAAMISAMSRSRRRQHRRADHVQRRRRSASCATLSVVDRDGRVAFAGPSAELPTRAAGRRRRSTPAGAWSRPGSSIRTRTSSSPARARTSSICARRARATSRSSRLAAASCRPCGDARRERRRARRRRARRGSIAFSRRASPSSRPRPATISPSKASCASAPLSEAVRARTSSTSRRRCSAHVPPPDRRSRALRARLRRRADPDGTDERRSRRRLLRRRRLHPRRDAHDPRSGREARLAAARARRAVHPHRRRRARGRPGRALRRASRAIWPTARRPGSPPPAPSAICFPARR